MNNKMTFVMRGTAAQLVLTFLSLFSLTTNAMAEESEHRELTHPKSKIEAGVGGVTDSNWKFGQYNGLNKSGVFGIGNFDIQGGGVYDSDDASRWRITGDNIGLETRSFTGEYKNQGQFKLNFGYDQIPVYRNNTYQTPYQGVGTTNLTLPNWQYPTTANNMRTLPPGDFPFHTVEIGTQRKRVDGGFSYLFSPQWEVQASIRHEDKKGTQALGATIFTANPRQSAILPSPVNQTTEQINVSVKYTGDDGFAQLAYYGSLFHNDINGVNFQNPFAPGEPTFGRKSNAPANQFHQFTFTGGYNFSPATKLVVNGSYGRNWQTQDFLPYTASGIGVGNLPVANLNGDVETKSASLKLTHRVNSDLNFAAAYKYDERENHTPINVYEFLTSDAVTGTPEHRHNAPYSKRVQQGNLDANYSFAKGHWLKVGYELQAIDRWCNGTWISCFDTGTTTEHTGRIDYRGTLFDKLSSRIGYAYSNRHADNYNQDNAAQAFEPNPDYSLVTATGLPIWGPALPYAIPGNALNQAVFPNNNPAPGFASVDINGLRRFNTANRERQKAHAYFDYQVTDQLSLALGGDFRYDNYPNSRFGLQSSRNWGINFDGSYVFDENTSIQVFYSYQDINSKSAGMTYGSNAIATSTGTPYSPISGSVIGGCYNNVLAINSNAKTDPCRNWFTSMNDNVDTVGLSIKHKGLLNGKLDINGDFVYSFARTLIGVTGGQYVRDPTGTTSDGPYYYIPATNMPTVKTQTFQFKLDGKYNINKSSTLHLSYLYEHMFSSDYIYTGMQPAGTPTSVMPTFEQAPRYSNHVIGLSYIYNF